MDRTSYEAAMGKLLTKLLLHRSGRTRFPWLNIEVTVKVTSPIKKLLSLNEEHNLADLITAKRMNAVGCGEDVNLLRSALGEVLGSKWEEMSIGEVRKRLSTFSQGKFRNNSKPSRALIALNSLLLAADLAPMMQPFTYTLDE